MSRQAIEWYVRRLQRMSTTEMVWRVRDQVARASWAHRQIGPGQSPRGRLPVRSERRFSAVLRPGANAAVPDKAGQALIEAADKIMAGRSDVLGVERKDLGTPDWFYDPVTGRRSDPARSAFRINYRSEDQVGNVKQVWELSRHHHLTQLAAAWFLTKNDAYADRVAEHLRSWWQQNPFLSGVHWTSGIEVALRLINWTWIRRLLDDWSQVTDLFDNSEQALWQIYWHQRYLAAFRSKGSSANNHVIAEAAGQLVAACAFPWFDRSDRWRADAARLLRMELRANTFPSGLNRELATDYHRFVAELGVLAAVEADAAGCGLGDQFWHLVTTMFDAAAALVDKSDRPPRQGDDDEGRVLVIDPSDPHRWSVFLALGAALVGPADWWPSTSPNVLSALLGCFARGPKAAAERPERRPSHFADAGLTLLRTTDDRPEIWCRCDGGPHGFLSIAAHAHADALSVEVRVGGVDILADPGTYCYHGEQEWRNYFRSTLAHNTVEVAGRDQSSSGGPFLWLGHATGRVINVTADDGEVVSWTAEHDGYLALEAPTVHHRMVSLDRVHRRLRIEDCLDGSSVHEIRLAYHFGPDVSVVLDGNTCRLEWPAGDGPAFATAELADALDWTMHVGETGPVLGWYSPGFGEKLPIATLVGRGRVAPATTLVTIFEFPC